MPSRLPNDFSVRIISSLSDYQATIASGYDFKNYPAHEDIQAALKAGACLICVFKGLSLAHTTWIAFGHQQAIYDSLFNSGVVGKSTDSFIGPCNTYEPFRGLGLYPVALSIACNQLRGKGMRRALINTKQSNRASIRGIEKANFKMIMRARVLSLLGRKSTRLQCIASGEC